MDPDVVWGRMLCSGLGIGAVEGLTLFPAPSELLCWFRSVGVGVCGGHWGC